MYSDGQREIVVVGGTDNADTRLNSVEIFNVGVRRLHGKPHYMSA